MSEQTGAQAPTQDTRKQDTGQYGDEDRQQPGGPDAGADAAPGAASGVLHRTDDEVDPAEERDATTASAVEERLRGWNGDPGTPRLSDEQVARLQEHEEPVAAANFGAALTGDLGNAEVGDEAADAPETVEPDTSLGHEGGRRYEDFSGGAGGSA
jgi:hypothetical protein